MDLKLLSHSLLGRTVINKSFSLADYVTITSEPVAHSIRYFVGMVIFLLLALIALV